MEFSRAPIKLTEDQVSDYDSSLCEGVVGLIVSYPSALVELIDESLSDIFVFLDVSSLKLKKIHGHQTQCYECTHPTDLGYRDYRLSSKNS